MTAAQGQEWFGGGDALDRLVQVELERDGLLAAAQDQGFAQYVCVVDECEIITEVPASELPAPNPKCPVHEHEMLLAGWRRV